MAYTQPWEIKRQMVQRAFEDTDLTHGVAPSERNLKQRLKYGIINFDKPAGPTSNDVTAIVKRDVDVSKAGHSGTLVGV